MLASVSFVIPGVIHFSTLLEISFCIPNWTTCRVCTAVANVPADVVDEFMSSNTSISEVTNTGSNIDPRGASKRPPLPAMVPVRGPSSARIVDAGERAPAARILRPFRRSIPYRSRERFPESRTTIIAFCSRDTANDAEIGTLPDGKRLGCLCNCIAGHRRETSNKKSLLERVL